MPKEQIPADKLAQAAYDAYGEERNWKTFKGDDMPEWDVQTEDLKAAWRAAALAVVDAYETAKPGPQQAKPKD